MFDNATMAMLEKRRIEAAIPKHVPLHLRPRPKRTDLIEDQVQGA